MNYKNINNPQARSSLIDIMNTLYSIVDIQLLTILCFQLVNINKQLLSFSHRVYGLNHIPQTCCYTSQYVISTVFCSSPGRKSFILMTVISTAQANTKTLHYVKGYV